jgi:hypothetical protein
MNDDSDKTYGGFFQFPIGLLAADDDFDAILYRAPLHGVVHFLRERDLIPETWTRQELQRKLPEANDTLRCLEGRPDVLAEEIAEYWANRGRNLRGSPRVRLSSKLFFEIRDCQMLTETQARVLLGLYSIIGAKAYAKAGWRLIQARAAGLTSPIPDSHEGDQGHGPIYTRRRIDLACDELLRRKFVSGFTYNCGERFWSHRISTEAIAKAVAAAKIRRHDTDTSRAEANAKFTRSILAHRVLSDVVRRDEPKRARANLRRKSKAAQSPPV